MKVTYQPGRMKSTLAEHLEILEALKLGNSELAMNAARSHVRLIGSELEDFIASLPNTLKK
jgi:DNA-binding GntR family transcriptional regulator